MAIKYDLRGDVPKDLAPGTYALRIEKPYRSTDGDTIIPLVFDPDGDPNQSVLKLRKED